MPDDDDEDTAKMSMNCFSGNIKTLEVIMTNVLTYLREGLIIIIIAEGKLLVTGAKKSTILYK